MSRLSAFVISLSIFISCKAANIDTNNVPVDKRSINVSEIDNSLEASFVNVAAGQGISKNYRPAQNKAGSSEYRRDFNSDADIRDRYGGMKVGMDIGYRRYNVFWSEFEGSGFVPRGNPNFSCPAGYVKFPVSQQQKQQMGFKSFHCYLKSHMDSFAKLIRSDFQHQMQTGVVVWSTPDIFREPNCAPEVYEGRALYSACFSRANAMDHYEDFIRFLNYHYGDTSPYGKMRISHWIIWNEAGSKTWSNFTPKTNHSNSAADIKYRVDRYADMMRRSYRAILKFQNNVMMYASTDPVWSPAAAASHKGHMSSARLLDELWKRLGVSIDWSVAVHPYGDPFVPAAQGHYSFANLDMVYNFQQSQLANRGLSTVNRPQTVLITSEQGWKKSTGDFQRAKNLCKAHDIALSSPYLLASAHVYFHRAPSDLGDSYGLIDANIPYSLTGVTTNDIGKALYSLHRKNFRKNNTNWCCVRSGIGCSQ